MMDLEEVWKDSRDSFQPILPRKPYPVFKLPPVVVNQPQAAALTEPLVVKHDNDCEIACDPQLK
jgi:hypothetical protein